MNDQYTQKEILRLTREYSRLVHKDYRPASDPERKAWQRLQYPIRRESIYRK